MKPTLESKEEEKFFEQLNARTKQRKAEHEAQEFARTDEENERVRDTRAARKWRCVLNLSLCAVFMGAIQCLCEMEHISYSLYLYAFVACLLATGWHTHATMQAFRRKG